MAQQDMAVHFKYLLIYATILTVASALTLPNQPTNKPRHTKPSSSTTEPASGSLATPASTASKDADSDASLYRYSGNSGTCILLKTDAVVEVNFLLHNLEEQADSYIPKDALVEGDCKNEDESFLSISWKGHSLKLYFGKTPGGEMWYLSSVQLVISPSELSQLKGIQTNGKVIKLHHKNMLLYTPVGKSYACEEVDIDLETDQEDDPPAGLRGSVLLRKLRLQPFMYKGEDFEEAFECKPQRSFRDETAPIAVGSTLAIAVLMTVTGYGIFRYFKIKNVQYNTME